MKKVVERVLIFIIGVPAFFSLIYFLPFCRHLAYNIFAILFSAVGAVEFSAMLEKKQIHISKIKACILGALTPFAATLTINFNFPESIIPIIIISGAGWVLLSQVFSRSENMDTVINRLLGYFSVMIYPGFFIYWAVKMTIWGNSLAIVLYLLIVFVNDSVAWLTGSLFGKNNRGLIPASPNKSIVGFIGGLIGTIILCVGAQKLFPGIFGTSSSVLLVVVLATCTGIAGSLGDLAESAIKRSCNVKDSGRLMLGRGGILDSIDSIAVAAPVYFLLYNIFFFG